MKKKIYLFLFLVPFIVGADEREEYEYEKKYRDYGVVCTQDVFKCPNGEYVGRSGPNCEFDCSVDWEDEEDRENLKKKKEEEKELEDKEYEESHENEEKDNKEKKNRACTKEFKPVCGKIETDMLCIKEPCPDYALKTFPNKCLAKNEDAEIIHSGECFSDEKKYEGDFEEDKNRAIIGKEKSSGIKEENKESEYKYEEEEERKEEENDNDKVDDEIMERMEKEEKKEEVIKYLDYYLPKTFLFEFSKLRNEQERREYLNNKIKDLKKEKKGAEEEEKRNEIRQKIMEKSESIFGKFDKFDLRIRVILENISGILENNSDERLKEKYNEIAEKLIKIDYNKAKAWLLFNSVSGAESKEEAREILNESKKYLNESKKYLKEVFSDLRELIEVIKDN